MAYIDRNELQEYPFEGEFYTTEMVTKRYDEQTQQWIPLPLDEQTEREVNILTTCCDITEASHARVNGFIKAMYSVFVPFCKVCQNIPVNRGDLFRAWQYGVLIKGKVEGVFPSQLGGYVCYVQADEIANMEE